MTWSPGEMIAGATVALTVVWQIWDRLGKGRSDALTRGDAERSRLETRIQELEKARAEDRLRLDKVETELDELRADRRTLIEYLRDVVSGQFDYDWLRRRAADLLGRMGGPADKGGTL